MITLHAISLGLDTLSFIPQGSMELVEVLGCLTRQIVKFSNWTQIPTNHLNLKNYCFTLTSVLHVLLLFTVLPFRWRNVLRMLLLWCNFHATGTPSILSWKLLLNGDFNFYVNDPSDGIASRFLALLNCFNLDILKLCTPTHKNNNVLQSWTK